MSALTRRGCPSLREWGSQPRSGWGGIGREFLPAPAPQERHPRLRSKRHPQPERLTPPRAKRVTPPARRADTPAVKEQDRMRLRGFAGSVCVFSFGVLIGMFLLRHSLVATTGQAEAQRHALQVLDQPPAALGIGDNHIVAA